MMSLLYPPVFNSSRFDDFFKWWLCDQTGFVATKTSQLVDVAAQAKEDASGKSALQNCFLDVKLKDVHILALSKDELTLAVCAGDQTVYLYDVPSLVHKVRISSHLYTVCWVILQGMSLHPHGVFSLTSY